MVFSEGALRARFHHSEPLMSQPRAPSNPNRGLGRVFLYYVVMGGVTAVLLRFPEFRDVVSGARLGGAHSLLTATQPRGNFPPGRSPPEDLRAGF